MIYRLIYLPDSNYVCDTDKHKKHGKGGNDLLENSFERLAKNFVQEQRQYRKMYESQVVDKISCSTSSLIEKEEEEEEEQDEGEGGEGYNDNPSRNTSFSGRSVGSSTLMASVISKTTNMTNSTVVSDPSLMSSTQYTSGKHNGVPGVITRKDSMFEGVGGGGGAGGGIDGGLSLRDPGDKLNIPLLLYENPFDEESVTTESHSAGIEKIDFFASKLEKELDAALCNGVGKYKIMNCSGGNAREDNEDKYCIIDSIGGNKRGNRSKVQDEMHQGLELGLDLDLSWNVLDRNIPMSHRYRRYDVKDGEFDEYGNPVIVYKLDLKDKVERLEVEQHMSNIFRNRKKHEQNDIIMKLRKKEKRAMGRDDEDEEEESGHDEEEDDDEYMSLGENSTDEEENGDLEDEDDEEQGYVPNIYDLHNHPHEHLPMGIRNSTQTSFYKCNACFTILQYKSNLISKNYRGQTGSAMLVYDLNNVKYGECVSVKMMTGVYECCNIYCLNCSHYLGWKYLKASCFDMKYKEGLYIIENKQVIGASP